MARIILDKNNNNINDNAEVKYENSDIIITDNIEKELVVDEFVAAFPNWNLVPPLQVIKRVRRSI